MNHGAGMHDVDFRQQDKSRQGEKMEFGKHAQHITQARMADGCLAVVDRLVIVEDLPSLLQEDKADDRHEDEHDRDTND